MVTFEWLPPVSWKLNKIRQRGEFFPRQHSSWFSRRSCSLRDPCTQSRPGSHSKALHTQLGNRAFVQTFGTQDSVQKQEMPSPCFSHGSGRRPRRILINLVPPEKHPASHADTLLHICVVCTRKTGSIDRGHGEYFFFIILKQYYSEMTKKRGKYSSMLRPQRLHEHFHIHCQFPLIKTLCFVNCVWLAAGLFGCMNSV